MDDNFLPPQKDEIKGLGAAKNSQERTPHYLIEGHTLSGNAQQQIARELHLGNQWLAYNTLSPFLEKYDVFFFGSKGEAIEFAQNNISDVDNYRVISSSQLKMVGAESEMQETILNNKNTTTMNQKNYDYLKDQVKFTGFGEVLQDGLKEKMQKGTPEFQLYYNGAFGKDIATAALHFKKSEQSDMYFFNKYDLTLKPENSADMMKQTFYIGKTNNITLKEAYNLMSGRAVNKDLTNKEGQVYNAWLQIDFKETDKNGNFLQKQYHQNYGFDLEKELRKHPIKELMSEPDKTRLLESLQKGNRQAVTFTKDGADQRMFVEANPKFKTVTVYSESMQRVQSHSQKEKEAPQQSVKQENKRESMKQASDDAGDFAGPKQKRSRKKGQSIS